METIIMCKRFPLISRRRVLLLTIGILAFSPQLSESQTLNNIEVRVEGASVFYATQPDSVYARITPGSPFSVIWSFESVVAVGSATVPFKVYSPDGSITQVIWNSPVTTFPAWSDPSVFTLGGASISEGPDAFGGALPSTFFTGGTVLISGGYGPTPPQDIFSGSLTVLQEGVLCVDTALFPPSGIWLFSEGSGFSGDLINVTWGASVGGYPAGGFCIEISECTTCDAPGDFSNNGSTDIVDVSVGINHIFNGGPAPFCPRQADSNGDGAFNIADVIYLIARIFLGGPAPICGP
jgi:hypothetical protein